MIDHRRVLVIGLDSATFDLIKPWAQGGYLPNLKRLMTEGCSGLLASTIQPYTPSAWVTFMTGVNQGKHGIFDFMRRRSGTYDTEMLNATHIGAPTVFEIASQAGLNVVAVNVPYTYPPRPVKGVVISGPFAPNVVREAVYPPEKYPEIQAVVPDYAITPEYNPYVPEPLADYKRKLIQEIESRETLSLHLMRREPWDLFMVVFMATDMVQHVFWNKPESLTPNAMEAQPHVIRDIYQRVDQAIGSLLAQIDAERNQKATTVMVVSDHGAGPLRAVVNLNSWLAQQGYLRFQKSSVGQLQAAALANISRTYRRFLPGRLRRWVQTVVGGRRVYQVRNALFSSIAAGIDWPNTRAYAFGAYGDIHINLEGREPQGIVKAGAEYESLCQEIAAAISGLREPATGAPIVKRVHRRDELYTGDFVISAPDLVIEWQDYAFEGSSHGGKGSPIFTSKAEAEGSRMPVFGGHRLNGILIARDAEIPADTEYAGARMVDMAPTVLQLLGIMPPSSMDGHALDAIVKPAGGTTALRNDYTLSDSNVQADYTPEEEAAIAEHLKSLGYF